MKMFAQKKMIVLWFAALALLLAVSACTDYAEEFKDEYRETYGDVDVIDTGATSVYELSCPKNAASCFELWRAYDGKSYGVETTVGTKWGLVTDDESTVRLNIANDKGQVYPVDQLPRDMMTLLRLGGISGKVEISNEVRSPFAILFVNLKDVDLTGENRYTGMTVALASSSDFYISLLEMKDGKIVSEYRSKALNVVNDDSKKVRAVNVWFEDFKKQSGESDLKKFLGKVNAVGVTFTETQGGENAGFLIAGLALFDDRDDDEEKSSSSAELDEKSSSSVEEGDAPSVFLWRGDQNDGSVVWKANEDEFFVRFPVPMDSFAGTMSERMKALIDTCKGVCGKMLEKIGSNSNPSYVKNFSAEIDISNSKGQWKGLCAIVEGDSVTVTVNATRANYMTAKGEYADTSLNVLFSDSLLKSLGSKLTVYFMKKGTGYFNIRALGNYDECKNLNLKNNGIPQDSIIYPLGKTAWKYLNPEVEYGMLTDSRDGNRYKTVSLYNKVWMAENLNYSVESNQKCGGPDGLAGNGCNIYGSLYGKESLENACPSGWHVATDGDWDEIVNYMGGVNDATPKLMSKYEKYDKSKLGTNESGLSVVNAGYFDANNGAISSVGKYGDFWRVGEYDGSFSYTGFGLSYVYVPKSDRVGDNEYSVRCVRDEADEKSPWSFLNAAIEYKTMTDDRDGHVYKTIDIGTQTWFAENLGYDTLEATVCRRDSCDLYGRMYLASKVQTDKVNFCPAGWRIPTVEDWNVLENYVNDQGFSGSDLVSQKYGGKNSLGFSATVFGRLTNNSYVNTEYAEYMSTTGYFHINESVLSHGSGDDQNKQYYRSIRCLRGAVEEEPSCKEKYASWCNLNSEKNYETFVDERDSREYKVIEIEGLEGLKWFAENLAYKPSGDTLTYCGNNSSGCDTYGRLYSNSEVNQGSSFCPDSWRIPSDDEMDRLINSVSGSDLVSQKENGGSNASGFSAVYAKRYTSSGYFNDQAEFLVDDGGAYRIKVESSSSKVSYSNTTRFHSIRCVQGTLVNSSSSEDPESSSSIAESSSSVAE